MLNLDWPNKLPKQRCCKFSEVLTCEANGGMFKVNL